MFSKVSYKSLLKYSFLFLLMLCSKFSLPNFEFLPISVFSASLYLGLNYLCCILSFSLCFIASKSLEQLFCAFFASILLTTVFAVYKKLGKKPKGEILTFVFFSTMPYLFYNFSVSAVVYCFLILLHFIVSVLALRLIFINGFYFKTTSNELFCLAVFFISVGIGAIKIFGEDFWRYFCFGVILYSSFLLATGHFICLTVVLSLPSCFIRQDLLISGVFAVTALCVLPFKNFRPISGMSAVIADFLAFSVFDVYNTYGQRTVFILICIVVVFSFTPEKLLSFLNKKIYAFKDTRLIKNSINRMRSIVCGKLLNVSYAFAEMQNSLYLIQNVSPSETSIKLDLIDSVKNKVCSSCPINEKCCKKNFPNDLLMDRLLSVGIAKNRLSFVDLPKDFTENCSYPNGMLYELNYQITKYKESVFKLQDVSLGRELITVQAKGLTETFKNLAYEIGKPLPFNDVLQNKIQSLLAENGICANEILVYGEDFSMQIDVTLSEDGVNNPSFVKLISKAIGVNVSIVEKIKVSSKLCAVCLKPSPLYDACFGVSKTTKKSSTVSGDTHSLCKIDQGKFIVAINDGMGSGENAHCYSSVAINLIETFYKAGLSTEVVLSTVNKLLGLSGEDDFTAIDIVSVDLYGGVADFIKIGSPFGFVLEENGIKIIEGSSLPLGIMEEVDINSASCKIKEEATVVIMSDGITDAFGSSSDALEFLQKEYVLNPQLLADKILNQALFLQNGNAEDDMTVVCVRIFKKY